MVMDMNTRLIDLTAGELVQLIEQTVQNKLQVGKEENEIVEGLAGLAKILGVSITTAQKIKNSGILDKAIGQVGRKILIDKKKAIELYLNQN